MGSASKGSSATMTLRLPLAQRGQPGPSAAPRRLPMGPSGSSIVSRRGVEHLGWVGVRSGFR